MHDVLKYNSNLIVVTIKLCSSSRKFAPLIENLLISFTLEIHLAPRN